MSKFLIELGSRVESQIDGFKGIVVCRSEHLNKCNRYWVQPPIDKDGKPVDGLWYDEMELKIVGPKLSLVEPKEIKAPGGFPSTIK